MKGFTHILFFVCWLGVSNAFSQKNKPVIISTDSTTEKKNPAFTKDTGVTIINKDTILIVPKHNPGTATLRSLIIPGWGQAYNREYWKIPIVYGALGTVAVIYLFNNTWYKRTRDAYDIRVNHPQDSSKVYPDLQPISASSLQNYRNSYRQARDYSALWFLIMWGLNIADATVFGHLKQFDVSEDLSLKVNPVIRQNGNAGLSLVLGYRSQPKRTLFLP